MCIMKSVTEKSRHFFDFSTIIASIIDLCYNKNKKMNISLNDWRVKVSTGSSLGTHPIILENRTAALSIHPNAVQMSKYFAVNIRSIVILVANKTWFIWNTNPSIK
jgi:hypothetical protein